MIRPRKIELALCAVLAASLACDLSALAPDKDTPGDSGAASSADDPPPAPDDPPPVVDDPVVDNPIDNPIDDPIDTACVVKSVGKAPLRLLTRTQYANAIRDVFSPLALDAQALSAQLPQDVDAFGFETNAGASLDDTRLGQLLTVAEGVSQQVVTRFAELMPCALSRDCAQQFIARYGRRAYRREVSPAEQTALLTLWDTGPSDAQRIRAVTEALLVSPELLYQVELGEAFEGKLRLTASELATKLSLFLWNTIPDDALLDAAQSGALLSEAGYLAQFERLFADPRAKKALVDFHLQWLEIKPNGAKDAKTFPEFSEAVYAQAIEETERFVEGVMFGGGSYKDLLLSTTAFVNPGLAGIYGVKSPGAGFRQVTLNPAERSGILTRLGFLASTSGDKRTSVTLRGVALRDKLLCQTIDDPPANIQDSFPVLPDDASLTAAQLIALHQVEPACAGCHAYIDPLGLLFEKYDAIGKHRTKYPGGAAVVSHASLVPLAMDGSDLEGTLEDALALSQTLADSARARACYVDNLFRFALLREVSEVDQCAFDQVVAEFYRGELSLKALFKSLALSPAFRLRSSSST